MVWKKSQMFSSDLSTSRNLIFSNFCHVLREKRKTFSLRIPVTAWSAGIAAMVVVTLGLGLLVFSGQNLAKNHKWSCYDGSYIEVNGKRITDVKKIMPCIIETLEYANEVEQLARQRIDEIHRSEQEIKEKEDLVNN